MTDNWRNRDGGMRRWWNYDPKQNGLPVNLKKSCGNGSATPAVSVVQEPTNG